MSEWMRLGKTEEVPTEGAKAFVVGPDKIAVFHQTTGWSALEDTCPHRGASLAEGFICDGRIACPWHQWEFDLQSGACAAIPGAKVKVYPVEIRDDAIWIRFG
jgi:nitrite reductase (NADH) small subunit/3-phenylpropionate/trans-cinnamate dioxygenase ferredoxin subunit